jgi:hypothetical protein
MPGGLLIRLNVSLRNLPLSREMAINLQIFGDNGVS